MRWFARGNLKIPDINQPVEDDLAITAASERELLRDLSRCGGRIEAIAKNHVLDLAKMAISQNVRMVNIDLAALSPMLPTVL